jgi:hypothetical protein
MFGLFFFFFFLDPPSIGIDCWMASCMLCYVASFHPVVMRCVIMEKCLGGRTIQTNFSPPIDAYCIFYIAAVILS